MQVPVLETKENSQKNELEALKRWALDFVTDEMKAEFIDGEIIVHSPARKGHIETNIDLCSLLRDYARLKKLGLVLQEKAWIEFAHTSNCYEPDICFWGNEKAQNFTSETKRFPPPDWVCEVLSPSTEKRDRGIKFQDYAIAGVREYWIIDASAETIEKYILTPEAEYKLENIYIDGEIKSEVIDGFCIPVRALFDEKIFLETLRKILA